MKAKTQFDSINQLSSWLVFVMLVLSALLIPAAPAAAAAVTEEWVARYNGPGNSDDWGRAIAVDKDGNVYVTGGPPDGHLGDYATVKYDPNGDELWVARYNGPGNGSDWATAIAVDASGNVYVTGSSYGAGTSADYATIKYDPNGNELWVARYTGPGLGFESATAMAVDKDGNVYVTGTSGTFITDYVTLEYATVKYDSNGNQLWVARSLVSYTDGTDHNQISVNSIALDASGNVYVAGSKLWYEGGEYVTIKYDPNGNQLWDARYHNPNCSEEEGYDCFNESNAMAVDGSGNVYVTGGSPSPVGDSNNYDYATIKYDMNGNQLWVARYNGPPGYGDDIANAIALDTSGNVYVTGYSYDLATGYDYATVKYDPNGNELWVARYNSGNTASVIAVDASGNVYVTGYSWSSDFPNLDTDYATVKYDPNGNQLWAASYNGPGNSQDWARAIAVDASGNAYVTGFSYGAGTGDDYATIKYSQAPAFDFPGLTQLIDSLLADGAIAGQLRTSLLTKVENAQISYEGGDVCAAVDQLNALKNQIAAQSGKKISSDAAERLLAYINDLITQLLSALPAGGSC